MRLPRVKKPCVTSQMAELCSSLKHRDMQLNALPRVVTDVCNTHVTFPLLCPLCTLQAEDGGIAALPPLRRLYASGGDGGVGEEGAGENGHHC